MRERNVRWVKDAFGRDIKEVIDSPDRRERSRSRDISYSRDRSDSYSNDFSDDQSSSSYEYHHHHSHHHHRHSSPMNPLDQKQRSIPNIPLANCNPRRTFYQFMRSQKNDITPTLARELFTREMDTYTLETTKRIFNVFCNEEWIQSHYLPSQVKQHLQERQEMVHSQHLLFCQQIATEDILKPEENTSSLSGISYSSRIIDDIYPNCVMVDDVPSNCSNTEFKSHLSSLEGIHSIYFGDPLVCPAQGLYRFAWITCENEDACKNVLSFFDDDFEYVCNPISKITKRTHLHAQKQPAFRRQFYLPSLLNQEQYIQEDLQLSYQLLRALEGYWNIETSFEPCLKMYCENHPTVTPVDQIYILTFFIRRVFGYDYWRNTDDENFGISLNKYSVDMIRNQGLNPEVNENDVEWIKEHRQKLGLFLESIQDKKFSIELEGEMAEVYEKEMELRKDLDGVYDEYLQDCGDDQYACILCEKMYTGKECGIQHINQSHYEKIETKIKMFMEKIALPLYMKDESKVVPIVIDPKKSKYHY